MYIKYTHIYIYNYIYKYTRICTHTYTHTHTHISTYTYTIIHHACMYTLHAYIFYIEIITGTYSWDWICHFTLLRWVFQRVAAPFASAKAFLTVYQGEAVEGSRLEQKCDCDNQTKDKKNRGKLLWPALCEKKKVVMIAMRHAERCSFSGGCADLCAFPIERGCTWHAEAR